MARINPEGLSSLPDDVRKTLMASDLAAIDPGLFTTLLKIRWKRTHPSVSNKTLLEAITKGDLAALRNVLDIRLQGGSR